jgi:hypothetical protein
VSRAALVGNLEAPVSPLMHQSFGRQTHEAWSILQARRSPDRRGLNEPVESRATTCLEVGFGPHRSNIPQLVAAGQCVEVEPSDW